MFSGRGLEKHKNLGLVPSTIRRKGRKEEWISLVESLENEIKLINYLGRYQKCNISKQNKKKTLLKLH